MAAPDRKQLPEVSREVLLWVADQLRNGYTGDLTLKCQDGGIRRVLVNHVIEPSDVGKFVTAPPSS